MLDLKRLFQPERWQRLHGEETHPPRYHSPWPAERLARQVPTGQKGHWQRFPDPAGVATLEARIGKAVERLALCEGALSSCGQEVSRSRQLLRWCRSQFWEHRSASTALRELLVENCAGGEDHNVAPLDCARGSRRSNRRRRGPCFFCKERHALEAICGLPACAGDSVGSGNIGDLSELTESASDLLMPAIPKGDAESAPRGIEAPRQKVVRLKSYRDRGKPVYKHKRSLVVLEPPVQHATWYEKHTEAPGPRREREVDQDGSTSGVAGVALSALAPGPPTETRLRGQSSRGLGATNSAAELCFAPASQPSLLIGASSKSQQLGPYESAAARIRADFQHLSAAGGEVNPLQQLDETQTQSGKSAAGPTTAQHRRMSSGAESLSVSRSITLLPSKSWQQQPIATTSSSPFRRSPMSPPSRSRTPTVPPFSPVSSVEEGSQSAAFVGMPPPVSSMTLLPHAATTRLVNNSAGVSAGMSAQMSALAVFRWKALFRRHRRESHRGAFWMQVIFVQWPRRRRRAAMVLHQPAVTPLQRTPIKAGLAGTGSSSRLGQAPALQTPSKEQAAKVLQAALERSQQQSTLGLDRGGLRRMGSPMHAREVFSPVISASSSLDEIPAPLLRTASCEQVLAPPPPPTISIRRNLTRCLDAEQAAPPPTSTMFLDMKSMGCSNGLPLATGISPKNMAKGLT